MYAWATVHGIRPARTLRPYTKEPCISAKEPYISAKEPYTSAQELFKALCICTINKRICI